MGKFIERQTGVFLGVFFFFFFFFFFFCCFFFFFLFLLENRIRHFMLTVFLGDNVHDVSDPTF